MSITGREPRLGGDRRVPFRYYPYNTHNFYPVQGTKLALPAVNLPHELAPWLVAQGARVILEENGDSIDVRYVTTCPTPACEHETVLPEIFAYHAYEHSLYLTPLFMLVVPCFREECNIPF